MFDLQTRWAGRLWSFGGRLAAQTFTSCSRFWKMRSAKPAAAAVVCQRRRVLVLARWAPSCLALSGEEQPNYAF